MSGQRGVEFLARFNPADLFYSFGIHNPGAVRLHNYPKFLQNLEQDNGERFDLGTIDILRDRERGVPRYNRFRRLLHKPPVRSFEELTDKPEWAAEMKRVYNNDLEMVDTMVGLMAEPLPEGMGFSDTAFRIFLLMASRRLKSDRFLSQDYRPEIYTKAGDRVGGRELDEDRDLAALPVGRVRDGGAGRRQRVQALETEETSALMAQWSNR